MDVAKAFSLYSRDSTLTRRVGGLFITPIDVSYTRSLLSSFDASPVSAPVFYQFGLGGPSAFRFVNGVDATAAGQTGTLVASGSVLLPLNTSFAARYRHVTTHNWIARAGRRSVAGRVVDGTQTQFPDVALRYRYLPAAITGPLASVDASVGFVRTDVDASLPSLFTNDPPEIRRTHIDGFPVGASVVWAGRGSLSTGARYTLTRRVDSLPGSVAHTHGDEVSFDAGRAFHVPESWGLGFRSDLRTRASDSAQLMRRRSCSIPVGVLPEPAPGQRPPGVQPDRRTRTSRTT